MEKKVREWHVPSPFGERSFVPREEYDAACQTIAAMHEAAVGEVRGPIVGVVEDVRNVRAERDSLMAVLKAAPMHFLAAPTLGRVFCRYCLVDSRGSEKMRVVHDADCWVLTRADVLGHTRPDQDALKKEDAND